MYYQSMPLYLRLIELLKIEYRLVHNFPKAYKHGLGEDILELTWKIVDLFIVIQITLVESSSVPAKKIKEEKLALIRRLRRKHQSLQLRLRFCRELKLTSLRQQTQLDQLMVEIDKMISSWLRNA